VNVLYHSLLAWTDRSRFLDHLSEMATIRSSGLPLLNAPTAFPDPGAFLGTDPLSLAANFLFARSRTNRQRMAERVTSTGRRYVQVKA
jgi:hypothetical protein